MLRFASVVTTAFLACSLISRAAAEAQSAPPSETPAVAPSATPAPQPGKRKFFQSGPTFISVGVGAETRVRSEFRPGSGTGEDGLNVWQTGETTLFGRVTFAGYTDFRSFQYQHFESDPVATIGGGGSTIVPNFTVHENELENGTALVVGAHVAVGLSTFGASSNVGYPDIKGFGYALMLDPAAGASIAPYARVAYFPNVGGNYTLADDTKTALTYRGLRYRAGVLIREPGTRFAFDLGFAGENLTNRTNAPAPLSDGMATLGLDYRF